VALRAGSFSRSVWFGVLREESYPHYVCTHPHKTRDEARNCASAARRVIDDRRRQATKHNEQLIVLPGGWKGYVPGDEN
jgi:hypothetical protein